MVVKSTVKTCTHCNSPYDTALTHICLNAPSAANNIDMPQPNVGMVIDKKYRLENKLGEGGMGSVFRARRLFIDDFVAIKFVRPEVLTNPEFRERFYQEARVAARLKHANVVTVYDFGETPDGMLYLVMEFLEGMSLGELLKKKSALGLDQMIELGRQISEALQCMHENNVIHRDLKPDNIMLIPDGRGGELVKVVDFGVAKILEADARLTRYQARIGSPVYCSPEQYLGQPVDHRTDLYGLGIIFYECLSGRVPFNAVNETELRAAILHKMPPRLDSKVKQVSGHMADLVQWLLAKDPNDRPHHAAEVTKCLHALRRGQRAPQTTPAAISPSAEGTAQTKKFTPNGIVFNEPVVLPRRENQKPATRQKPAPTKEEIATKPARPSVHERAKTKRRGRRYLGAVIFLVLMSSAALAVWKVPEFAMARQYAAMGWNDLTLRMKSFSIFEKATKENPRVSPSLRKAIPVPSRPAQTEKTVSLPPVANAPIQPPATAPNKGAQKSDARPGLNPAAQSIDSRPVATNNKKIEARRGNTDRRESKKTSNALIENRSRATTAPLARVANKPAPPAGMILITGAEFKRGDLFGDGNPKIIISCELMIFGSARMR